MVRWLKRNALVIFLCAFAFVYHCANYPLKATLRRPSYSRHRFDFKIGEKIFFQFEVPARTLQAKTDGSAQRLGEWGYELRYWARQFPFDMVEEKGAAVLHLFHRNHISVQYPAPPGAQYPFPPVVRDYLRAVSKVGVTPVLLPLPTHLSIDRPRAFASKLPAAEQWGDLHLLPPENPRALFDTVFEPVRPYAVDLYSAYERHAADHPDQDLFIPYDFHWNSLGIAVAAKAVVDKLIADGWDLDSPKVVEAGGQRVSYFRTLLNFLQLPQHYLQSHPEFQFVEKNYRLSVNPRKPRNPGRLVLAATSFALNMEEEGLAFSQVLGDYLGREVVQSAFHGAGARGGLDQLKENGFTFRSGDLFVYELSVLYAMQEKGDPLPVLEPVVPRS